MATGYTMDVGAGTLTDIRTFILRCARIDGALIHQRDDRMDADIELRRVGKFYAKNVEEALEELNSFLALTREQAFDAMQNAKNKKSAANEDYRHESLVRQERFKKMLAQVEMWEPPTSKHTHLKDFMKEQLQGSIDWERPDLLKPEEFPETLDEWIESEHARLSAALDRAITSLAEETARCKDANEWIQMLINSLPEKGQ